MTVYEASLKLFGWFAENDYFCVEDNLGELLDKELPLKGDRAAVDCALKKLEKMELISSSSNSLDLVWVNEKPFATADQEIKLSSETCLSISHVVNAFCDVIGNEAEKADPMSISEQDVKNLLFVASHLMSEDSKKEDEDN